MMIGRHWLGLGLTVGMLAGCIQVESFQCQNDDDCIHEGQAGQCRLTEQTCVYPDPSCATQWSTANGECLPPAGVDIGSSGSPEGSGDSGSADGSSSTGPGPTTADTTESTTSTVTPIDCSEGVEADITAEGVVGSSSVFSDNFHAFLASDGDLSTSWFSSGPEPGGLPSIFQWTVLEPRCIMRVNIIGNGLHQNTGFREDFGFESVIVRVYDQSDEIVFQQMLAMIGTPDPPVVALPGVAGVRVELELFEHESNDCGGFSELEVSGF